MKTINLVTLVDFMEDFLFAKIDIEEKLIESLCFAISLWKFVDLHRRNKTFYQNHRF